MTAPRANRNFGSGGGEASEARGGGALRVAGKLALALVLAFWARSEWERVRGQGDAGTRARLDRIETELASLRVEDLEAALARVDAALAQAERARDRAVRTPRPAAGPDREEPAPAAEGRVPPDRFGTRSRREAAAREDASARRIEPVLSAIDRHVEGLSKDQRGEVERILLEADQEIRKASSRFAGRADAPARMREASYSIRSERYRRLERTLDPVQLRQLVDDVPFALGPPVAPPEGGKR